MNSSLGSLVTLSVFFIAEAAMACGSYGTYRFLRSDCIRLVQPAIQTVVNSEVKSSATVPLQVNSATMEQRQVDLAIVGGMGQSINSHTGQIAKQAQIHGETGAAPGSESQTDKAVIAPVSSLQAYPNPSDGNLNLVFDYAGDDEFEIRVSDLRGVTVYRRSIEGNGQRIVHPLRLNVPSGVYIATIRSLNGVLIGHRMLSIDEPD